VNSSPPAGVTGVAATVTGVPVPESVMPSDTVMAPARAGEAVGAALAVVASVAAALVAVEVAAASGSPRGAGRVCAVHAVPSQ
jgi:hypothetical protein